MKPIPFWAKKDSFMKWMFSGDGPYWKALINVQDLKKLKFALIQMNFIKNQCKGTVDPKSVCYNNL